MQLKLIVITYCQFTIHNNDNIIIMEDSKNNQKKNIFRLSAILYSKTNNVVSNKSIVRKVIEDAIYCCGQEIISLSNLISYINSNYALLFSETEITKIVTDDKSKDRFIYSYKDGELLISLTQSRKNKVTINCLQKTLIDYIEDYLNASNCNVQRSEKRNIILQFLYNVFTSNIEVFKRLLNDGVQSLQALQDYSASDRKLINEFLYWNNDHKNKAIFDLANYSLEYCMLTNSKNTNFQLQNLKNKNFYLDTNILYRAIGLNGEELKTRTLLFLSKFNSVQENLYISRSTKKEFEDTISFYIDKLGRKKGYKLNSKVILQYISKDSVLHAYHKWSLNRVNNSLEYFRLYLLAELDSLCKKYNIKKDDVYPYDAEKSEEILSKYKIEIQKSCTDKTSLTAEYDAQNILWVESKRGDCSNNLFDTKNYFLSSDKSLYFWDYSRIQSQIPVVMPPSQWIGIILRYIERTDDDYRSFISFLTMKTSEQNINTERIISIVAGIDEITNDIEFQESLIKNYIESETADGINQMSEEEIELSSKSFAEKELDKRLRSMQKENEEYVKKVNRTTETISKQEKDIRTLKKQISQLNESIKNKESALHSEMEIELNKYRLLHWRLKKITLWLAILLIMASILFLTFFLDDWEYNYIKQLINFFDSIESETIKEIGKYLIVLPFVFGGYSIYMIIDAISIKAYNHMKCKLFRKSKE